MHSSEPKKEPARKEGTRPHDLSATNMPARVDPSVTGLPDVIKSEYLTARLQFDTSSPPRLLGVSFDAHTASGQVVATYRTVESLHPLLSDRVIAMFSELPPRFDPAIALRRIYQCVTNPLLTTWEVIPARIPTKEGAPCVYPAIPQLEALVKNPEIVDNHITTHWASQETVFRLSATILAERGYAMVTIDQTPLDGRESSRTAIKLLIPREGEFRISDARTLLQEQVLTTFARMYEGGLESVTSFLQDDPEVVAGIVSGSPDTLDRIDDEILSGGAAGFFNETRTLDSGATASLVFGRRMALLTVVPNDERPEIEYRVSFECENQDEQLSAAQLHYLLKMYGLITSDSEAEQEEGMAMCLEARGSIMRRPVPPLANTFSSARDRLKVSERPRNYLPQDVLGVDRMERLGRVPGLAIATSCRLSAPTLSAVLAGTLVLTVQRTAAVLERLRQEDITQMELHLLNDGDIDLYIVNGLSTVFHGRLRPADELGIGSVEAAEIILELFADQPSISWRFLMSKITIPEQGMFGAHPFGLRTTWRNDFPPLDDPTALRMYEEAAKFHAWTLGNMAKPLPAPHIRCSGAGRIEMTVRSNTEYPAFGVVFDDGVLSEISIVEAPLMTKMEPQRDDVVASFRSNTLTMGSALYQEFLDRLAIALHECSLNRFRLSKQSYAMEMVEPIHKVLSHYMVRVQ